MPVITRRPQPGAPGAELLFDELYQRLRRLARSQLRRNEPITLLDTTGLVHEAYLRLAGAKAHPFADRPQFLAYASRVMRCVVVDFIRRHRTQSRGGGLLHVTLNTQIGEEATLHDALEDLARVDDRLASIVEMRCFGGLSEVEIGQALGVTERTVRRQWQKARLLLRAAMD